jgi:hypothetical protein
MTITDHSQVAPRSGEDITQPDVIAFPSKHARSIIDDIVDLVRPPTPEPEPEPVSINHLRSLFFAKTAAQTAYMAFGAYRGSEDDVEAFARHVAAREHLNRNWLKAIRAFEDACTEFFGYRAEAAE